MNFNYIITAAIIYILGITAFKFGIIIPLFMGVLAFLALLKFKKIISLKSIFILPVIFIAGFLNADFHAKDIDALGKMGYTNNVSIEGRIISPIQKSLNKTRIKFYVDVDVINHFEKTKSKTIVTVNNDNSEFKNLRIGDIVYFKGSLRHPSEATNPSQFSYANYLKNKNVFSTFYVKNDDFEVLYSPKFSATSGFSNNWWAILQRLDIVREKIIEKHGKFVPSPELEVLGGIVFGDDAVNPPDNVKQTFVDSGLLHLLAASGLNVGIIFFMWFWLASRLGFAFRPTIISSIFFIALYTFMTGFPPSILRASIMLLFVLIGKLIHRETDNLALVFLVGFILLIFDPNMLFDVGFELSFVVTIGLIICVPIIINLVKPYELGFKDRHQDKHPFIRRVLDFVSPAYLTGIVAVPLVAQIFVAPIQMFYFNTFTPYSILANIIVIPFVAVISFLGFSSSILSFVPFLSDIILRATDFVILPFAGGLLNISSYFAAFPHSVVNVPSPSALQIIFYYFLVLSFFNNFKNNFRNKRQALVLLCVALIFALSFIKIPNRNFEITMFDVGNADCFLIKSPNGKYFLIDTGKLPYRGTSSFNMIVGEYFKDNNIKELESLIVTHFDNDHAGGVSDVLKHVKVKNVYVAVDVCDNRNSCDILNYMNFNRQNFEVAKSNEVIFDENGLKIINLRTKNLAGDNNNSIITLVKYKNSNSLFMGDAGVSAFENIKKQLSDIDVLKVGHHGARGVLDKNMLEYLSPEFALVSVGLNSYGHPNAEIIDLIKSENVALLMTRDLGAVRLIYDEKTGKLVPYHFDGQKFEAVTDLRK